MYGLIGGKLGHSYSKIIHEKLADYEYNLIPLNPEEFKQFMTKREFTALNVTIPYKEAVIPYLDSLDPIASRIGAVNTIFKKDGKLIGANTDYYGFKYMVLNKGLEIKNTSCIIIGDGGASKAVKVVLQDLGAKEIVFVSYRPKPGVILYEDAYRNFKDTDIIVNTSPVGMFPHIDESPIKLEGFPHLKAVIDLIYNPIETKLYKEAKAMGIPALTGLEMLVAQAKQAVEHFTGHAIEEEKIDEIYKSLRDRI